ncbi:hypothetical protein EIP91_000326 [Steccherinum ochraceum]|uniref:SET domain-containing protein n=1 Tax=Steccherinum ochraceum TaxID=92696 RepID=A0A4R0RPI9_9APHY|nr:hypothetical protein EIP91_000326 [Steccherinum ochraceum]
MSRTTHDAIREALRGVPGGAAGTRIEVTIDPNVKRAPFGVVTDRGLPAGLPPHTPNQPQYDARSTEFSDDEIIVTRLPPGEEDANSTMCMVSGRLARKVVKATSGHAPVPQPIPATFCIREAPGKGLGMFATRDILAGELIVAERPLLVTPAGIPARRTLPEHLTQAQVSQVLLADAEREYEVLLEKTAPALRDAFMALVDSHRFDGSGPISGRIRTNGFGADDMTDPEKPGYAMGANAYSLVCDNLSRMNHNCAPNAPRYFHVSTFSMQVRAIRAIKNGEEITTAYCETLVPFVARKAELARYDVKCTCSLCINPSQSDPLLAYCKKVRDRTPRASGNCDRGWYTDFSVPESTAVKSLLADLAAIVKVGQEFESSYVFTLFQLMKTYAARGDVTNARAYAKQYAVWHLAVHGKEVDDKQVESAFGMVAVAEVVLRMKGKMKGKMAGGKANAAK